MAITLETIVKLPTSRKVIILVLLIAVVAGLFFYLIYWPNLEDLKKKKAEEAVRENKVRVLRIVAADKKRWQEEAVKLREELKVALTQLPSSKEIPSLLSNISQLGKDSGLEFLLFKPVGEINKDFYAEIPVEIKVKGAYNNVATFFDKVGKLPRIVNISEVSMDSAKEVLGRWEINTSCTATTFKFVDKEPSELAKDKKSGEQKGAPPSKK